MTGQSTDAAQRSAHVTRATPNEKPLARWVEEAIRTGRASPVGDAYRRGLADGAKSRGPMTSAVSARALVALTVSEGATEDEVVELAREAWGAAVRGNRNG